MQKKYTKELLIQQKEILLKEKKKTVTQIDILKKEDPFSDPEHASDNAAVDTDVREQVGHETVVAQIKDLEKHLDAILQAIVRIDKKTYGQCQKCDSYIPLERLKVVPEASYCIECEKKLRV